MFDFDKYLSAIFKKISSLDEKFREYREDYNKKDKKLMEVALNNEANYLERKRLKSVYK